MDPVTITTLATSAIVAAIQIVKSLLDLYRDFKSHRPGKSPTIQEIEDGVRKKNKKAVRLTMDQLQAAKKKHQYIEGSYHLAVAGISGTGKSSLVNALRGLHNRDPGAASTGENETTTEIGRYPDPDEQMKTIWYDVPGAGTPGVPDLQYFEKQGLFVFDAIIVAFSDRIMKTDIHILKSCKSFGINSYIVRTKADEMIQRVMDDEFHNDAEGHDKAREVFVNRTREYVLCKLNHAELPEQKAYIVSKKALALLVNQAKQNKAHVVYVRDDTRPGGWFNDLFNGVFNTLSNWNRYRNNISITEKMMKDCIHKHQLLYDFYSEAQARRPPE